MQSLSAFLRHALADISPPAVSDPVRLSDIATKPWYLSPSFSNADAFSRFHALLLPACQRSVQTPCRTWKMESDLTIAEHEKFRIAKDPLESYWTLQQLSDVVNARGSLVDVDLTRHADADFVVVCPTLVILFGDVLNGL
jgi:hypothetical protein